MKVAFISPSDPRNKQTWSGILYSMYSVLEQQLGPTTWLRVRSNFAESVAKRLYHLPRKVIGESHLWQNSLPYAKRQGKQLSTMLREGNYDLIFAAIASPQLAFLETKIPIIYCSDATFKLFNNEYGQFKSFSLGTQKSLQIIERRALNNATLFLPPTRWAARSAKQDYGTKTSKIEVIPFGANIFDIPNRKFIKSKISGKVCKLLFIGVDWERKGGPLAFDIIEKLNAMGLETQLTIIGCNPPIQFINKHVNVVGFIDKNSPKQSKQFQEALRENHFLLLPTRAECFGIVFAEASAYGLPSIATRTGGVSGVVKQNVNGYTLSEKAGAVDYAEIIFEIFRDKKRYQQLVESSRFYFEERLNWKTWGEELKKQIRKKIPQPSN